MLIRFMVENFLSFKDEVEFSMVAGESDEHPDHVHKVCDMRILKTGVIFGANASGKTNLIKAMSFAQNFIASGSLNSDYVALTPFLLDAASPQKPSRFLFEIQCGIGQSFEYIFELDRQNILFESLFDTTSETANMIFERNLTAGGQLDVRLGNIPILVTNEADPFDFLPKSGEPHQLFLTQYKRLEQELEEQRIPYIAQVYDWFNSTLAPIFTDSVPATGLPIGLMQPSELQNRYLEIIDKLDLDIDDVGLKEVSDFNPVSHLSEEFIANAKQLTQELDPDTDQRAVFYNYRRDSYVFADANADFSEYKMATIHKVRDTNNRIYFDLRMESDGTRRLLKVVPALFGLLGDNTDYVFVLDELDKSLHTLVCYKLLELFLENSANRKSQLIVTTHDTSLLDLDLLRRDEIWFLEKDGYGVSSLFSLEEFELSRNVDIEKGYLGGRLGAIPILLSDDKLEWAE